MRFLLALTFAAAIFIVPMVSMAALGDIPSKLVPCNGPECNACHLVALGQNILSWLIGIMVFVVAVMIAIGGLMLVMSGGNPGKRERAKSIFSNALIGFIILLSAWLIVDTLLKVFLPTDGTNAVLKGFGPWNKIQCVGALPPVSAATPTGPGGVTVAPGAGVASAVGVRDASGNIQQVAFNATQSDTSLTTNYTKVNDTYGSQINSACSSSGAAIPNCAQVVAALIASESAGDPTVQSSRGSVGLLQLLPENGGQICSQSDSSCIQGQIDKGVSKLNGLYSQSTVGGNTPNALAAYNGGQSVAPGGSTSGLRPPLAPSLDCPGLLAYQCATNPGGLQETRGYVGNICRTLTLRGSSC